MAHYLQTGNTIRVVGEDDLSISNILPAANYIVQFDKQVGEFFLEKIAPFEFPSKLYGDVIKNSNRIINTFRDRSSSTGVLLSGEKGCGKTLIAKNISCELLKYNIATIVINDCHCGDLFNKFIQSINQSCVIMFDEFEKVYNNEKQEQILTLLDGVFQTKKLFILTTNDTYRINIHLHNRPGRIFYAIKHDGLEDEFIREYCNDVLINKSYINEICKLTMLFASFNFDMLKSLVEEMNRYNESPTEALVILNATPDDRNDNNNSFDVQITIGDEVFEDDKVDDGGFWTGNPMHPRGIYIEYRNPNYDDDREVCSDSDDNPYWLGVQVSYVDLVKADSYAGTFEFKNKEGQVVKLTKHKNQHYQYKAF